MVAPLLVAAKTARHDIFAAWICRTFGSLARGCLDVAGGKGGLANALVAAGAACTNGGGVDNAVVAFFSCSCFCLVVGQPRWLIHRTIASSV